MIMILIHILRSLMLIKGNGFDLKLLNVGTRPAVIFASGKSFGRGLDVMFVTLQISSEVPARFGCQTG
jgi:hypothetical protein